MRGKLPSFRLGHDGLDNEYHNLSKVRVGDSTSCCCVPGPFDAARASSPMKKSKSSVPRFIDRCPPDPAPPVRYEGLFATAGRPDPELAAPPPALFVAIAVGNTKEGESLPAKPGRE